MSFTKYNKHPLTFLSPHAIRPQWANIYKHFIRLICHQMLATNSLQTIINE